MLTQQNRTKEDRQRSVVERNEKPGVNSLATQQLRNILNLGGNERQVKVI